MVRPRTDRFLVRAHNRSSQERQLSKELKVIGSLGTQKSIYASLEYGNFCGEGALGAKHHFDFRLEKDGVFKSWAVPKGLPEKPGLKRLAVQVEDYALELGQFHETIPEGEYGRGGIKVWDHGTYELEKWTADRTAFTNI
jgi:DNA ligase D-like protein (predicted 3'-phosphoesterase)